VRPVLFILLLLAGCSSVGTGKPSAVALKQERLKFQQELAILTYHSQCPAVHPAVLDPVYLEIESLKTAFQERIQASALKAELDASQKEMDRQASYSNESDCVGVAYPNSDQESVTNYRSIFAAENQKLATLAAQFQSLSRRIVG
jgi:hypothetical protein